MIESGKRYRIKGNSDYFRDKYGTPNPIIKIEDEDTELFLGGWQDSNAAACIIFGYRCGVDRLPFNGKVYYGHIKCAPLTPDSSSISLGELVHESELEPYEGPLIPLSSKNITFENSDPALMDGILVSIPMLPPKEVSPNYHGELRAKMSATKAWREAAYYCARQACPGVFPNYEKAVVRVTFQVPSQAYIKDDDNAIASVKPALDGCVQAGIVCDDSPEHLRVLPVVWDINKAKDEATILEFIKLEEVK